jgi:hypothetical protein
VDSTDALASLASARTGSPGPSTSNEEADDITFGLIVRNSEAERAKKAKKARSAAETRAAVAQHGPKLWQFRAESPDDEVDGP